MLMQCGNAARRLEGVYAASSAPTGASFEDLINHWHQRCGMTGVLRDDLHRVRIWRNASDHHDAERWRRDGPRSEAEAAAVLQRISAAIRALEARD